jgi:hypothetical protein
MEHNKNYANETVKLVALVNKRIDPGVAMNALAHSVAAITNLIGDEGRTALRFLDFTDRNSQVYPGISAQSFIILRGIDSDIRKVRERAVEVGLPAVCFTNTMTGETYVQQLERTKATPTQELIFYVVVLVGKAEEINPITKKYSLWRGEAAAAATVPAITEFEAVQDRVVGS